MSPSEASKTGVKEWDEMYVDGKHPFGQLPFAGIDALLKDHVPASGTVLDIGSGYGRDALYLAREHGCSVVAVEPSSEGTKACAAAASAAGLSVAAQCAYVEDYDFAKVQGTFDMVLLDSVLAFLESGVQSVVVKSALQSLKPGGHLVVLGWPNKDEVSWVARLIAEADCRASVTKDADVIKTSANFDGEDVDMTWHVTVAKAA
eukprot:TRINITY_DN65420_c0_g1_i1.p1 TRINITY_DN65420_c0_g1~~TRINITY_DN65420_c0_g1_i1.p1  ORF type:complete len:204 (+),score=38.17 TRINITY_DN65420_c0_g1_i1:93-704(+)